MEYTANTGTAPCLAMPAAMETAHPSAMPTSKKRLGYALAKASRPVPPSMAAVRVQIRRSVRARRTMVRPNTLEKFSPDGFFGAPVSGSKGETP